MKKPYVQIPIYTHDGDFKFYPDDRYGQLAVEFLSLSMNWGKHHYLKVHSFVMVF